MGIPGPVDGTALSADVLAVVLAGGQGVRLGTLTRDTCKPALPFGGAYRCIDFSLSNCLNSGITRVGVALQYKPQALLRHIDRVWRPEAEHDGNFVIPWTARERAPGSGYSGTADAVYRNLDTIDRLGRRFILVLAGDHVYRMDYRPLIAQHAASAADVTVGCIEVPMEEANRFGVLSVDDGGHIRHFVEKPETTQGLSPDARGRILASMGIYVFDADFLGQVLRQDAALEVSGHDFGHDILPRLIGRARTCAFPFRSADGSPGYWRDVGTPTAYWRAHLDLLGSRPALDLEDALWPLKVDAARRGDACAGDAFAADSILAARCAVPGASIRRSVLCPDVSVAPGADVRDSILLPGASVDRHCRLSGVIVGSGCRVPVGTEIHRGADGHTGESPPVLTADSIARLAAKGRTGSDKPRPVGEARSSARRASYLTNG